jgi:dienelactone hydrolase
MAEVLLFHHAQGPTPGFLAFADQLRGAGHTDVGGATAARFGFGEIINRGAAAAAGLPAELVYAGFSLGVLPAQSLAQTRAGARGALLFHSCVPISQFGSSWPDGVPVQVHAMEGDPFFVEDGDIDAARALVDQVESAELFLYPGDQHLFADSSLPAYDPEAAALLSQRVLGFLSALT